MSITYLGALKCHFLMTIFIGVSKMMHCIFHPEWMLRMRVEGLMPWNINDREMISLHFVARISDCYAQLINITYLIFCDRSIYIIWRPCPFHFHTCLIDCRYWYTPGLLCWGWGHNNKSACICLSCLATVTLQTINYQHGILLFISISQVLRLKNFLNQTNS